MGDVSNTGSNTSPTDAEREHAADHGIHWHKTGGWARKFPGDANRTYFGRVTLAEAIAAKIREEDRRDRGELKVKRVDLRVRDAVNLFLNHLDTKHAENNIGPGQRASYGDELDRFIKQVGLNRKLRDFCELSAPDDLFAKLRATAMTRGVFAAEKHVAHVRTFLDWCSNRRRYIPAPFYADAFNAPTDKEKRAAKKSERKEKGVAYWEPAEVREIVSAAKTVDEHFYAQVLLVLNGGMGAKDLADLEDADVDWERNCIHTDRSKTLVPRVVPLWTETAEAMKASRSARPEPRDPAHATRFFLTDAGRPVVYTELGEKKRKTRGTDAIRNKFYRMLNGEDRKRWKSPAARLRHLKRHRAGFYTLRSVFATLSKGHPGGDPDLPAVIMGHQLRQKVMEFYLRGDLRAKLVSVVEHVKTQIWSP